MKSHNSSSDQLVKQHDKFQTAAMGISKLSVSSRDKSYSSRNVPQKRRADSDNKQFDDKASQKRPKKKEFNEKNREKLQNGINLAASVGSIDHIDDIDSRAFVKDINMQEINAMNMNQFKAKSPQNRSKMLLTLGFSKNNQSVSLNGSIADDTSLQRYAMTAPPKLDKLDSLSQRQASASLKMNGKKVKYESMSTASQGQVPFSDAQSVSSSMMQIDSPYKVGAYTGFAAAAANPMGNSFKDRKNKKISRISKKLQRLEKVEALPQTDKDPIKSKYTKTLLNLAETASFSSEFAMRDKKYTLVGGGDQKATDQSSVADKQNNAKNWQLDKSQHLKFIQIDEAIDIKALDKQVGGGGHVLKKMTTLPRVSKKAPKDSPNIVDDDSFHSNKEHQSQDACDLRNQKWLDLDMDNDNKLVFNVEQDGASIYDFKDTGDKVQYNKNHLFGSKAKITDDVTFDMREMFESLNFPMAKKKGFSQTDEKDYEEKNALMKSEQSMVGGSIQIKPKTIDDHRTKYYSFLTQNQIWLPPERQPKSHQNLIVLDWDDTLLPTTYFLNQEQNDDESDLAALAQRNKKILVAIQRQVLPLLENLVKFGKVIIITNAKEGWVEYSSYYMLPRVFQLIETYVPVISAQDDYIQKWPKHIEKWKQEAFLSLWDIDGMLDKDPYASMLNLIVVGDSNYEINAGRLFKKKSCQGRKCHLKLIKLKENPTPLQLEKQLLVLNQKFNYICGSQKSLNIQLESNANNKR